MQAIVLFKISFVLCSAAWSKASFSAEDWHVFTLNQSNLSLAIDKSSIVVEGKTVRFWERVEFARPDQIDEVSGRLIKSKRIHRIMHCEARTQGVLRGSLFGENNKLIEAIMVEVDKVDMKAITPGTVAEQEWAMACAQLQQRDRAVSQMPPLVPLVPSVTTDTGPTTDARGSNTSR